MWQFLCDQNHQTEDAKIVSLYSVFESDRSIGKLSNMPYGFYAVRQSIEDDWHIYKSQT